MIVPEEAKYGFEPCGYWNKTFAANWSKYPWTDMKNSWSRRKGWLTTSCLASDDAVKALASSAVQAEGHWLEAQKFAAKVAKQVARDKAGALATVARFLQIPLHEIELVTFDPKSRQRKVERLSRH